MAPGSVDQATVRGAATFEQETKLIWGEVAGREPDLLFPTSSINWSQLEVSKTESLLYSHCQPPGAVSRVEETGGAKGRYASTGGGTPCWELLSSRTYYNGLGETTGDKWDEENELSAFELIDPIIWRDPLTHMHQQTKNRMNDWRWVGDRGVGLDYQKR